MKGRWADQINPQFYKIFCMQRIFNTLTHCQSCFTPLHTVYVFIWEKNLSQRFASTDPTPSHLKGQPPKKQKRTEGELLKQLLQQENISKLDFQLPLRFCMMFICLAIHVAPKEGGNWALNLKELHYPGLCSLFAKLLAMPGLGARKK